jgi:phosphatidylglycerol:prolipoprotein diacylglycerol transferase
MFNELLTIGPLTIHGYGLMTAVGILAAYFSAEYRARKKGLQPERIFGLVICCVVLGYLCSKLLYILTILPDLIARPEMFLSSLADGWVVYGGILGGILGGWLYCRWKKLETWKYFDLGLASVALAQGFGRIGCFLAGCCYGAETTGPLAVVFPETCQYAPAGVPLVPTQLISSALDFLLFFFLILYDRKGKKRDGEVTAWYLILYSAGRFILEFWRGDSIRGAVGALSTSQFIGIFTFLAGIILLALRRKSRPAPETAAASAAGEEKGEEAEEKGTGQPSV